ncbi:hypothetical protein NQZ68_001554 [Dissostichus eleginoides]|nr:hypothetical protein NQZ68_001554 [Dissostichus eleginoides]
MLMPLRAQKFPSIAWVASIFPKSTKEQEKSKILREKKSLKQSLQEKEKEWKVEKTALTALQTSQSPHLAQVEMQEKKTKSLMAALQKIFEDQVERERFLWQQERTSLLQKTEKTEASYAAQLHANDKLAADLKEVEQQLENNRIQYKEDEAQLLKEQSWTLTLLQEEKSTLLQEKGRLQQSLQEKEDEWKETQSSLNARHEGLESQVTRKEKRSNFFKKLLPCIYTMSTSIQLGASGGSVNYKSHGDRGGGGGKEGQVKANRHIFRDFHHPDSPYT